MKNKYKILGGSFILLIIIILISLYNYKEYRINNILQSKENLAIIKYNYAYNYYKLLSQNAYNYIIDTKETKNILKQIKGANTKKLDDIRKQLYIHLKDTHIILDHTGFREFHFHLKDNTSFLRLHKPSKYGDNLTGIRYGVELVNKTHKYTEGFEEGRIINGFRFIYPLINNAYHLGSVEISVSSKGFINIMQDTYKEDIYFLVKKSIVDSKTWKDELFKHYKNSAESDLYYVENFNQIYKNKYYNHITNNKKILSNISKKIKKNTNFTIYTNKQVATFLPINNIEGKKAAYFVIYTNSDDIKNINFLYWTMNIVSIFILMIVLYILYKDYIYRTHTKTTKKELQYHRNTLQTIVYILNELITNKDFNKGVENSIKMVIKILNIDRIYIFENHILNSNMVCSQKFEFVKDGISAEIENQALQNISYSDSGIKRWKELFLKNKHIEGLVKNFLGYEKEILESQDIKSILVMPIWYEDNFWGFIGFDDCTTERIWHELERDILRTLSNAFISALHKEKYSISLEKQVLTQIQNLREKDKQLLQQSKLAQMGDMVSMIAHQWRQPLNAISATGINISLMSSMGILKDEKIQESSKFIQDQAQKMSSTIDTFMNFVKPRKESTEFKLAHTIKSVMHIMGSQLSNHNIHVEIKENDKDISIVAYEDLLEQVIINLLSNARDAFKDLKIANKYIKITILSKNTIPVISIEDNAGGIPQNIQDKIFNPYFTTKEQGQGTGIGLYMSMDIMKKSFDGNLIYNSTKNGSLFEIICGEIKKC